MGIFEVDGWWRVAGGMVYIYIYVCVCVCVYFVITRSHSERIGGLDGSRSEVIEEWGGRWSDERVVYRCT